MTTDKTSQAQQSTAKQPAGSQPFNPMAAFAELTKANLERLNVWTEQYTAWEATVQSRAAAASGQAAELATESMQYLTSLVTEWRNQAREAMAEATRRGTEMFKN